MSTIKNRSIKKNAITENFTNKLDKEMVKILLPISSLMDHEDNERIFGEITDESVNNLKEAISRDGFIGAIDVWELNEPVDGKKYKVFSGHRRKKAMELLGETKIPCFVYKYPENESDRKRLFLTSNTATRGSINAADHHLYIARQIQYIETMLKEEGFTGNIRDEIADFYNVSPSVIQRYKTLLKCSDKVLELEDQGIIPLKQAAALSAYSKDLQDETADKLTSLMEDLDVKKLSGSDVQKIIEDLNNDGVSSRKSYNPRSTVTELYIKDITKIESRLVRNPITLKKDRDAIISRLKDIIDTLEKS